MFVTVDPRSGWTGNAERTGVELVLPDLERAKEIGEVLGLPGESRLRRAIDCEEDRTLRAVLVGMLRETDR